MPKIYLATWLPLLMAKAEWRHSKAVMSLCRVEDFRGFRVDGFRAKVNEYSRAQLAAAPASFGSGTL